MEDFLSKFGYVLLKWPERALWTVSQISDYTQSKMEDVCGWLAFALKKDLDSMSKLTLDEGEAALEILKEAHATGVHVKQDAGREISVNVKKKFDDVKKRLIVLGKEKDWRRAYKTITSLVTSDGEKLGMEAKLEALAECLRLGIKAELGSSELAPWMKAAVLEAIHDGTKQGTEEGLDLIDAYGSHFVSQARSPLIESLFNQMSNLITKHNLNDRIPDILSEISMSN